MNLTYDWGRMLVAFGECGLQQFQSLGRELNVVLVRISFYAFHERVEVGVRSFAQDLGNPVDQVRERFFVSFFAGDAKLCEFGGMQVNL